ncbi:sperm flagellar protein 2-like [Spodoptera frugiperda]|uniref:Sperm flagellar protein 2-like n=1 Tax=Spodoptera frugiperda TaxID=7108 RepID=A0A9R0D856_SPOFR|nr:sperm flagellar protein 2-like [Spodoptera frugiperda]
MAEILKEWLTERLNRPISWEAEQFGDMMKNGYVIAGVLNSYNVINDEKHFLIRSSLAQEDIKSNWKYLTEWLADINVYVSASDLENIMDGKGSAILRLFYKMFLHLDKRDRTNFIKRERKMVSSLIEKMGHRFKVDYIPEGEESVVDDLAKPLLNEQHFIEWQRKKTEQVKDTYDYIRHKYSKMLKKIEERSTPMCYQKLPSPPKLSSKEREEMERFALKYPCKFENYTYDQLLAMETQARDQRTSISDSEWSKAYMSNLYSRLHKKSDSEEFQKQIRNVLSGTMWDLSIAEEENKLDTQLAKKVMKLSQFEKQMCTQIMETKQQARNLVKNRIQAEKEFAEQRELQFNQYLDNVKEQIQLEMTEIDFEKERQNVLHKRLYAEKMRRKRLHYYDICYDTILSIVDYATKYAYFKRLIGDDIPEHYLHEWKVLYYKQQPIFDILEPTEDILKERVEEEMTPEEEEVIRLELERQDALNDNEFKVYHDYSYPWTLDLLIPNYDPESEERKYEYLGTRILGHMVYTLLEIKYPYPPPLPPANLPSYTSKALIRGLPERSLTVPMQVLLNTKKIHVVRLENAINFCLRKFKTEMIGCTDIDLSFDKFIAAAPEEEDKELIKLMKLEDDAYNKSNESAFAAILSAVTANSKQTQTPKTIPEEDIKLSDAAELGRYAYESLGIGDTLTDHLIAATIVEYLKDQDDITGFVIINYPNSYREAQILEETFSGRAPPNETELEDRDDIYLEECIAKHRKKEKDTHKEVRVSRLVSDPHKKKSDKPFESYFTCYIHLKESQDILQELVIWDLTETNSELIDRFYAILGLNYSMYYEAIDKELLALICKYIIGDLSLPLKSTDSLFGEHVLSLLEFPSNEDKKQKSRILKPEVIDGKSKEKMHSSKPSRSSMMPLEVVKEPSLEEAVDEHIPEETDGEESYKTSIEEIKLLAGEEDWNYGELPIPQVIGVALATCWQEIEKVYIHDMQQLFFAKRLQMNCLIPYARFIKDKMEQIITLPSNKQDLVCNFQREYNDFESDWRDINVAKNEWHCRVKELQNQLYKICDARKLRAEQQRLALISDNWTMEELTAMVNTYISCMQAELNRSFLTFQSLHDFYFSMIKRMPSNEKVLFKELAKIYRDSDDLSGSRKGAEDKVFRQLKMGFQELQHKNIEIDFNNNPFNLVIENNVKFALKVIKETNDSYRSVIAKEYSEVAKVQPPTKKKDENTSEESVNAEEVFKEQALKCIEEWTMGINGEMFRASLRMQALQYKCYRDMKLFNDHVYKTFTDVQDDINNYYINEIKSVDRLCKYLQMAVENGRPIQETLVLENDTFMIDPNLLQFAPPEPPADTTIDREIVGSMDFKISQLAVLRSQFKIIAPTGIIMQQAFIYLLQDFIFFGKETCDGPLFPEAWLRVDPEQVPKLVFLMFGDTVYVDWRDFLIYCLNIRFPLVEELLEARTKFRCKDLSSTELIDRDDFIAEELWFESDFDAEDGHAQLRLNLIKHFLFELFETMEDKMNYSAFLLAFSKDMNAIAGFATALSMAVGKRACFDLEECGEVVCKLIKQKQYRDECLACAHKCTQEFIDKVLEKVIIYCEGTSIIELEYVPPVEEKKSKKGKVGKTPAGKKGAEPVLNTRVRSQKSLVSKSRTSASTTAVVKTTFICRPCEDEADAEEKLSVKPESIVEVKLEPEEDPNVMYAVSQSVIWNVLQVCLPWHFVLVPEAHKTPYIDQLTDALKRLEVDTDNGDIYVCRLVTDPNICTLLHKVKKFTILNLAEEVVKVFGSRSP